MILSDKEICKNIVSCGATDKGAKCSRKCSDLTSQSIYFFIVKAVKAQHKKDKEDFIKWGEGTCPHGTPDFGSYHIRSDGVMIGEPVVTQCFRYACEKCWQEFKEE